MIKKFVSFFCFCIAFSFLSAQEQEKDFILESSDTLVSGVDSLHLDSIPYDWISYQMKVNVSIKKDRKLIQVFFVNRIDSIIYLNFNLFGIEIARAVATPDSFIFVNKLEETYYKGDFEWISKKVGCPIDFDMLQAIFNARDFRHFDDSLQWMMNDNEIHLISPKRCHNQYDMCIMQDIELNSSNRIVNNDVTDLNSLQSLVVDYEYFEPETEFPVFSKMKISAEQTEIEIVAELKNAKINVPGPTRIKIPEKFEPLN